MSSASLIAIDLDGTLLGPSGEISDRSVTALRTVGAAGRRVVIATGRPPFMVDGLLDRVDGAVTHLVAGNGAVITCVPSGTVLRQVVLEAEPARAAVTRLRVQFPGIGFAMATELGFSHEPGFAERMPATMPTPADDDVLALGGDHVAKLMAFHPELGADELVLLLTGVLFDGLDARHLGADAVEIGPSGIDKGSGLAWLCDHLGVPASEVLAFGDESNDITMLQWAGRGIAMANAPEAVRAVADEIAPSNLDDGVAHILERLPQP